MRLTVIQFWKKFFEASAGVHLTKYVDGEEEDQTNNQTVQTLQTEDTEYTHTTGLDETTNDLQLDETSRAETTMRADYTSASAANTTARPASSHRGAEEDDHDMSMMSDTSLLESLNLEGQQSTPRAPRTQTQWANIASPYSALRSELRGDTGVSDDTPSLRTTTKHSILAGNSRSNFLDNSPSLPVSSTPNRGFRSGRTPRSTRRTKSFDSPSLLDSSPFQIPDEKPVLHQVLDKTWRIQATPLNAKPRLDTRSAAKAPVTPRQLFTTTKYEFEDSDDDSPVRPDLQTKFFDNTPGKTPVRYGGGGGGYGGTSARKLFTGGNTNVGMGEDTFMDDDDDDELDSIMGSPPVTIQFSLPAKKLLATPAREASRRIVRDILETAGVREEDSTLDESSVRASGLKLSLSDDDEDIFR